MASRGCIITNHTQFGACNHMRTLITGPLYPHRPVATLALTLTMPVELRTLMDKMNQGSLLPSSAYDAVFVDNANVVPYHLLKAKKLMSCSCDRFTVQWQW